METHEIRCPGCEKHVSTMTLWRPRLPWLDDRYCASCGKDPAINKPPSPALRRWVLAQHAYWERVLMDCGLVAVERRVSA